MNKVYRVFVQKRKDFAVESVEMYNQLKTELKIEGLQSVTIAHRYDIQGVSEEAFSQGVDIILREPMVDDVILEDYPSSSETIFAIEYLPGQYDQRADACEQCFQLLTGEKNVKVKYAKLIVLSGDVSEKELNKIKSFLINPVDQRLATLDKYNDLNDEKVNIDKVPVIKNFIKFTDDELKSFLKENGMAMNFDDLKVTQDYFKDEEQRDPTETELKVLDTYWSDHCRHTTFFYYNYRY